MSLNFWSFFRVGDCRHGPPYLVDTNTSLLRYLYVPSISATSRVCKCLLPLQPVPFTTSLFPKAPCPVYIHITLSSQRWIHHCFTKPESPPWTRSGKPAPYPPLVRAKWDHKQESPREGKKVYWCQMYYYKAKPKHTVTLLSPPEMGYLNISPARSLCLEESMWGFSSKVKPCMCLTSHHLFQKGPIRNRRMTSPLFFKNSTLRLHSTQANPNVRG